MMITRMASPTAMRIRIFMSFLKPQARRRQLPVLPYTPTTRSAELTTTTKGSKVSVSLLRHLLNSGGRESVPSASAPCWHPSGTPAPRRPSCLQTPEESSATSPPAPLRTPWARARTRLVLERVQVLPPLSDLVDVVPHDSYGVVNLRLDGGGLGVACRAWCDRRARGVRRGVAAEVGVIRLGPARDTAANGRRGGAT